MPDRKKALDALVLKLKARPGGAGYIDILVFH
jgi:hypothetical protein